MVKKVNKIKVTHYELVKGTKVLFGSVRKLDTIFEQLKYKRYKKVQYREITK